MTATVAEAVAGFLEHKRTIGRKYHSEEAELRLLMRFTRERRTARLDRLTPAVLDDFLASRPRSQPRSFNHLRGVVVCLLDWAVGQGLLRTAPMCTTRRRVSATRAPFLFEPAQVRQLLEAGRPARQLPGGATRPDLSHPVRSVLRARASSRRSVSPPCRRHRHRTQSAHRGRRPQLLADRRATRGHPCPLRGRHKPTDRLGVHPQTAGHLHLCSTRVPMNQDLDNVNHRECAPCRVSSVSRGTKEIVQLSRTR
jgi:hypothetical protein